MATDVPMLPDLPVATPGPIVRRFPITTTGDFSLSADFRAPGFRINPPPGLSWYNRSLGPNRPYPLV